MTKALRFCALSLSFSLSRLLSFARIPGFSHRSARLKERRRTLKTALNREKRRLLHSMNLFEVIASCVILLVFSYSLVPCVLKGAALAERIRERKEILLEKKFLYDSFLASCGGGKQKVEEWKSGTAPLFEEAQIETLEENGRAVLYRVSFPEMNISFYGTAQK